MKTTRPVTGWIAALAVSVVVGLTTLAHQPTAAAASPSADITPVGHRSIQTIRLEPSTVDGQTSWIIEPDVPRVPDLHGTALELPPHIEQRLSRAFDLAQRGATYSANAEFREVLGLCALEIDAPTGGTGHRDALRNGFTALDEAEELSGQRIDWSNASEVRTATAGHSTPALNNGNSPARDSIQAVQLYYAYAEEQFAYACHGVPGASLAYYGLARTFVSPGTRYTHAAGKSAMLQRVALRIAPQNTLAGNELGVLLAQHGHLDQAESLFKQCVETDATPEAWQNLAAVYAKKGDAIASEKALAAGRKIAEREKSQQAFSGDSALAGETNQGESQQLVADSNTEKSNEDQADEQQSFWKKLQLSQKLPNVFRR